MYSRGPIIRMLEIAQVVSGVIAILALAFTLWQFLARTNDIQRERYDSYLDTCYAIRAIANRAIPEQLHPKVILMQSGLGDCVGQARSVTGYEP